MTDSTGRLEDGGHTPGPWHVAKAAARRVTSSTGIVICNAVLRNCGTAKTGIKRGAKEVLEGEANARLIAAAPELLEAVQRARRHADNIGITDGSYIAQLDAAIAKARGAS